MRMKLLCGMLPKLIVVIAALAVISAAYANLARSSDTGVPPPLRFTSVSYAEEQTETPAAKTDLSKCNITLAYAEFLVDGNYHTPKVTITYQGKKLKKNADYKLAFSGGRDAGVSTVKITGAGDFAGTVTKTYKGLPAATTAAPKPAAPNEASAGQTTTAAPKKTKVKVRYKTKSASETKAAPETEKQTQATTAALKKKKIKAVYKTTAAPKATSKATSAPETKAKATVKAQQTIKSMSAYTFPEAGASISIGAKASSGLGLKYKSSDAKVVAVDAKGVMRAKKAGTAEVMIVQEGDSGHEAVSRKVKVTVPEAGSREAALAPWRHVLIDTFFHINDRKYSHGDPGKYWKDKKGKWTGQTGKKGNTQSCVTISTVSLKRIGLLPHNSGCIWLSSNHGTKPNQTVRKLHENSKMLAISYPHKSLKHLAQNDMIRYGDILCRSGHTFVYMGKDSGGHPLIYESGSRRDIGSGTCVVWGHHSGGHADKLTGKINKQIQQSNSVGAKWRRGKIGDAAFRGHRASGNNLNKPVHIVCSIRTFKIRTSCINGTITPGNIYMAGESPTIKYSSVSGKPVEYVKVDGRKVKAKSKYTFKKITADHTVAVKFKQ